MCISHPTEVPYSALSTLVDRRDQRLKCGSQVSIIDRVFLHPNVQVEQVSKYRKSCEGLCLMRHSLHANAHIVILLLDQPSCRAWPYLCL